MTNTTLTNQNPELTKNYIIQLLAQLTIDYQNSKSERQAIAHQLPVSETEFTLLEEIELLTTDIRGYASQIKARGYIENTQQAIKKLKQKRVFDVPSISQLYLHNSHEYENIKSYLRMLDYLRLLILEYLTFP
ncbi:hypothetical protein [Nostoc sp. UHCC 0870]|uniref:hypothetical protein n=1 Tax=Nostoc sp. UHCC 0870 TaxID=2914041 RepID=UPI001EDD0721|nr:hypothetical protein [Nostoc sp. UHCC 0870]UKO97409.1 hypothetical protein L6494_22975 [Nostoc sp. UHCC 0870]